MDRDTFPATAPAKIGEQFGMRTEFRVNGASLQARSLPRQVEFHGHISTDTDCMPYPNAGLLEFRTVAGNASYRKGERFYLPVSKAVLVYGVSL